MRLMNMYGESQSYPLMLGESGRGRDSEEVRVDARRPPAGDDVGFAQFSVAGRTHCVITASSGQRGCLVRLCSYGCYTKGSCGFIELIGGGATLLASGRWATGIAGRCSSGPDQLWHVSAPALFAVTLSGGAHKGCGLRYVLADSARVSAYRGRDLAQIIATDSDPWVSRIISAIPELPTDLSDAVSAGAALEAAAEQVASADVVHFCDQLTPAQAAAVAGLSLPHGYTGGFDRPQSGVLAPGMKSLVYVSVGPGGGKRYAYEVLDITGVDVLSRAPVRTSGNHCSLEDIVGLVEPGTDFCITWREAHDGVWGEPLRADRTGVRGLPWATV